MQAKLLHLVKQPPIRYMQVSEPAKVWQKPMRVLDVQQCKCKQFGVFFFFPTYCVLASWWLTWVGIDEHAGAIKVAGAHGLDGRAVRPTRAEQVAQTQAIDAISGGGDDLRLRRRRHLIAWSGGSG